MEPWLAPLRDASHDATKDPKTAEMPNGSSPLTELEGALAERIFHTTFVVQGLADIQKTQREILQLLEKGRLR